MKGFRWKWMYYIAVILIKDAKRRVGVNLCHLKMIFIDIFVIFGLQKQCI